MRISDWSSDVCSSDLHFTPKHASWLNMAEIEIGVLRGQCLDRRIDNRPKLEREIAAWQAQRNAAGARVKWMFTTEKPAPGSPTPTQNQVATPQAKSQIHCVEELEQFFT